MEIVGYGVKLTCLTRDKIEQVRIWRNSEVVRRTMIFQEYITSTMQEQWFRSINNANNMYFIISYNGKDIGLSNIKDIDYDLKTGEVGMFIVDSTLHGTDIPIRASICGMDFVFENLYMESIRISVRRDNIKAINYNIALGYSPITETQYAEVLQFMLTKAEYYKHRDKILNLLFDE